jgi:branched-chain amino acid transport system ATP-binding protein
MLAVEGLCAGYDRIPVLDGIDLVVGAGERVAIVGANGTGKTTLLKALMGLVPATAGRVRFAGTDITAAPAHRRARLGIGYVPQGRELFPALSVRDNLRMGCLARAVDEDRALERATELFPALGPLLDRAGGSLSGGEQQLVALARALCGAPPLLLLDEPSEGIQPSIVAEIGAVLAGLRGADAPALVLVEQNLDFVAALADRVLVMQRGRIVREVAPEAARHLLGVGG